MKPEVICLMASSVDGRTLPSRWRPKGSGDLFEQVHDQLGGDAWLIGRVTGQEFAKGKAYPATTSERFPRENWIIRRDAEAYGIVLDAHGKISWSRSDIGGDPIVVVLTEAVSDAHLAGLRSEGQRQRRHQPQDTQLRSHFPFSMLCKRSTLARSMGLRPGFQV